MTVILTPQSFLDRIEELVSKDKMSYTEAIVEICAECDIETTEIVKFITPSLKEKLYAEAIKNNALSDKNQTISLSEFIC